jgi:hypothetical protein
MRCVTKVSSLLLCSTLAVAQQAPDAHPCAAGKLASLERSRAALAAIPAPHVEDFSDTDVLRHELDLELNPASTWVEGHATLTIRSQVDDLASFIFRLRDVYTITAMQVSGNSVAWTRLDSANVEATLDRPYDTGEVFNLYIVYSGYPQPSGMFGGIFFLWRGSVPEVFTFAEPWFAYAWRPVKEDLTDKYTLDLWVTVPETMIVASNGLLQSIVPVPPGRSQYRWYTNNPIADYLVSLAATNYHEFTDTWTYDGQSLPLQFFIYPEHDTPAHRAEWLVVQPALTVFSDLFGIYPFMNEKYGMAEWAGGGAMEHQTMTSVGAFFGWGESIYVHELAHHWWGDDVTCATWHDIWLNEGFATYCEALWYENQPGSPGEPWLHMYMDYARPFNAAGTVYCYDITNPIRILDTDLSYRKGAWVLHMLRHVLGDADFYASLAAYRDAFQGSAATTDDFRAVCESVAGRDLAWFFDEWVYDGGAPVYQSGWRQFTAEGQRYVELYIYQGQSIGPPVFTMPVDIQVDQDGNSTIHVVRNDAVFEHLLIPVADAEVTGVVFDPKPWILSSFSPGDFVEGPPKILTMDPDPNATLSAASVASFEIVFHESVVAQASDFTLVGARSGPAETTYAYAPDRYAVTLTPLAPLATDTYTLTIADTVTEPTYGQQLDGELVKPDSPDPLPSGDGVGGGAAVAQFFLTRAGDLNCDGNIDPADIDAFVTALSDPEAYANDFPGCPLANADANGDGRIDFDDIGPFVSLLGG